MNTNESAVYAKCMIETLLNVYALANMHKVSEEVAYLKTAAGWLETLDNQLAALKRELAKTEKENGK